jgi:hypothetical protein
MNQPSRELPLALTVRQDGSLVQPMAHDAVLVGIEFVGADEVAFRLKEESGRLSGLVAKGVLAMNLSFVVLRNVLFDIVVREAESMSAHDKDLSEQALSELEPDWREHVKAGNWFLQFDPTVGLQGVVLCREVSAFLWRPNVS